MSTHGADSDAKEQETGRNTNWWKNKRDLVEEKIKKGLIEEAHMLFHVFELSRIFTANFQQSSQLLIYKKWLK